MSDRSWIMVCGGVVATLAVGLPLGLDILLGKSDEILIYVGVLVTAVVGLIAHLLTRQANHRLDADREDSRKRLKLEAAMRAGSLFQPGDNASVNPAAAASALLALTRLLLIEALLNMSLAQRKPTENALRSLAVRLFGIWHTDRELRDQGCIATLIAAILPQMKKLGYQDFVQGDSVVHIAELDDAAATAHDKSDAFLQRIVDDHARRLADWAERCSCTETSQGRLAAALHWGNHTDRLIGSRP